MKNRVDNFFNKGTLRTRKAKKHASLSLIYRGIDLAIGLALVPLVLTYLDKIRYGIWMVLFSLTTYFRFMNIGLEQGLRNKLAEAKAKGDIENARFYVSTTYAVIGIISISFFLIFLIVNDFIDWTKILNTSQNLRSELSILSIFVFGSFSISFILKIITTILVADQKPSFLNLKNTIEKIIKLIFILILVYFIPSSLLVLGIGYSIIPLVVLFGFTIYFFSKDYKNIRPNLKYVKFKYLRGLMNLGFKFFFISIAVVVLFTTDNIIITQLFGPGQVTPYQIAHKLFGIPLMLFLLIIQPLWSAVTDAYTKKDFTWIKNYIHKLEKLWLMFAVFVLLMVIVSPVIYKLWIGKEVTISIYLSLSWAFFVLLQTYNAIFVHFINGVGKIKLQLILSIFAMVCNIPLSILLARNCSLGIAGVILATSFSILISLIFSRIQYKKIINKKASGIWAK